MTGQKDQPLISVVVPVKNGAASLAACLNGIRAQTLGEQLEIVVIDSGSTDGSLEMLACYPVQVHRIAPEEFNHGETRNQGVRLAQGKFIVMTVQDAQPVDDRWLERMVKHFDDPKVAGVCGQQVVPHELDKNPLQWFRPYSQPVPRKISFANPADFKNLPPAEQVALCGWDDVTAMYRRSALLGIPFRRVNFSEDAIWARDALSQGWALVYDYSARVYHYHHETFRFRFRRQFTSRYQLHVYFDYLTPPSSLIMDLTRCAFRSVKRRICPEHSFKWFLYNARLHTANWVADWIYWMSAKCAGLQTCSGYVNWIKGALRQKLYQRSKLLLKTRTGMENAYRPYLPELSRLATRDPADLYIAHNLQALPAAAAAARRWRAKLGFDAEDFHRGEIHEGSKAEIVHRCLVEGIEQKYIPQCQHLTAASDGIGAAYMAALGVRKPVTILNVFPLSERSGHTPPDELRQERRGEGMSFYWYSQVIGGDRGLDDVLQAIALLGDGVHLCVRGTWADGYERIFRERAQIWGVEKQIHVLAPAPPEQLVERAAQHDVGLALEPGETPNRRIAVTNKILNYFLAGLAIAATDVPGQRGIMERAPNAGFLFPPGDAETLAARLREWSNDSTKVQLAKAASKSAGETLFCWEIEKHKLLETVAQALRS